jgi:hypothetical protein
MGQRSRRRTRQERPLPEPVVGLVTEWTRLSPGEWIFLAMIAIGIVALALFVPGGAVTGLLSALVLGLLAGAAIALNRRRQNRR